MSDHLYLAWLSKPAPRDSNAPAPGAEDQRRFKRHRARSIHGLGGVKRQAGEALRSERTATHALHDAPNLTDESIKFRAWGRPLRGGRLLRRADPPRRERAGKQSDYGSRRSRKSRGRVGLRIPSELFAAKEPSGPKRAHALPVASMRLPSV